MKSIQTPAVIDSIRSKVDGSLGLTISTPEYSSSEKIAFLDLQGKNMTMTIIPTDEPVEEEIKVDKDMEEKPLHVRLRNTLYVLWDKKYRDTYPEYENFYKSKMNKWIKDIQEIIPE